MAPAVRRLSFEESVAGEGRITHLVINPAKTVCFDGDGDGIPEGLALVVEPRDVPMLRARIAELLGDDARRRAMGAAARAWAVTECSYDVRVAPLARLVAGDRSDLAPLPGA